MIVRPVLVIITELAWTKWVDTSASVLLVSWVRVAKVTSTNAFRIRAFHWAL